MLGVGASFTALRALGTAEVYEHRGYALPGSQRALNAQEDMEHTRSVCCPVTSQRNQGAEIEKLTPKEQPCHMPSLGRSIPVRPSIHQGVWKPQKPKKLWNDSIPL